MTTENTNSDQALKQKYFLVSKRGTVIFVFLSLVAYSAAVLWSEFVFSVSVGTSQVGQRKLAEIRKKNVCANNADASNRFNVKEIYFPNFRNPLMFDKHHRSGIYDDFLFEYPGCIAAHIVSAEQNLIGETIFYFDRATNKPTVKVTIESAK